MDLTLIDAAEASRRLFIDRSTLTRWVEKGKLAPAAKAPGKRGAFLFDPEDVARLAESGAC